MAIIARAIIAESCSMKLCNSSQRDKMMGWLCEGEQRPKRVFLPSRHNVTTFNCSIATKHETAEWRLAEGSLGKRTIKGAYFREEE